MYPKNRVSSKFKKQNNIYHCRYCCEVTENKNRICNVCKNTIKCKRCKKRLKRDKFDDKKFVCKSCLEKEKEERELNKIEKKKRNVTCSKCRKHEIIIKRYEIKYPERYVCKECIKEKEEQIKGKLVKCKYCKKDFELITPLHLQKCTNGKITYQQYLEEFGRGAIYSERYRNRMSISSKESLTQEILERISRKNKQYWKENREELCKKLKIAQNTEQAKENHRNGYLKYYQNTTKEQKEQRRESAKNSWKNPVIRKNRIEGLKSEKSVASRKKNIKIAIQTVQPKISKTVKELSDKLTKKGIRHELEFLFGFYHIDIAIEYVKLAVEVDGDYWHGNSKYYPVLTIRQKDRQSRDRAKTTYLTNRNWTVIRIWESELKKDFDSFIKNIEEKIGELS